MDNQRCSGIETQKSVQGRPTVVQALGAFLAAGYPADDFNLAYIGYFQSEQAFALSLLNQAELPQQDLSDYLEHDYWQFHGHWFCRYEVSDTPDSTEALHERTKELKEEVNQGLISPYKAISALLRDFAEYPDQVLAQAWNAAWWLPMGSTEQEEKDVEKIAKVVAQIRAKSTNKEAQPRKIPFR